MLAVHDRLPCLTSDMPGTGGVIRTEPEDFVVVELPAYEPSGEGDHVFASVQKRGLTTFEAVKRIAASLGIRDSDIGTAGLKDRHAITEQIISLPPPCSPEQVLALNSTIDGVSILRASRHNHKLRTGHLRGNRFTLRIRETTESAEQAAERARAILDELGRAPGSPNWYGAQRFGRGGNNASIGRALVRGEAPTGRPPRGKKKRLMISAYQSLLFNEYLRRRIEDGLYRSVIEGDLLEKRTGGVFISDGPELDQVRLDSGELAPTGPMFGSKMKAPPENSAAAAREAAVLAAEGIEVSAFASLGKLARGARRALSIALGETRAVASGDRTIELSFELPAGSYATAVLAEIVKGPTC